MPLTVSPCSSARAIAYDANGDESRWLLNKIEKVERIKSSPMRTLFERRAGRSRLIRGIGAMRRCAEMERTQKAPAALKGYLADELNNITFPGELPPARRPC